MGQLVAWQPVPGFVALIEESKVPKPLQALKLDLHSRYLCTLNLYRFLETESFSDAYAACGSEQQDVALKLIEELDRSKLQLWTRNQLLKLKLYEHLDMRFLRQLAQDLRIRSYNFLGRPQLIAAIKERIKDNEAQALGGDTSAPSGNVTFAGPCKAVPNGP